MTSKPAQVHGVDVDPQTRCRHYHGSTDVIAIKMKCCGMYYACKDCHEALADHPASIWPKTEWDETAVLCGSCGGELTIRHYMQSGYQCPQCNARFNPRCRDHCHYYFES